MLAKTKLTADQTALANALLSFLESDDFCFILQGYAGTGKTFMMHWLTQELDKQSRSFSIAAPTGRAAKIIAQKTKQDASTIHKMIYATTRLKEYKQKNLKNSQTFKYFFDINDNGDDADTVYIIDESSMISNHYSEGEFFRFGSGHLLNDLIKYIDTGIKPEQLRRKVIFIGDNAQLPPVRSKHSPALDADYLKKEFGFSIQQHQLTEIIRQQENSGILHNATLIRDSIKNHTYNCLDLQTDKQDIHEVHIDKLLDTYIRINNQQLSLQSIIVCHSNNQAKDYNQLIRSYFFPKQETITQGDQVIIVANNYNYPPVDLLNGDFATIIESSNQVETRTITIKKKDDNGKVKSTEVPLAFRDVTLQLNQHDKVISITCKIYEPLLYSHEANVTSEETKALYVDFCIRHKELKRGSPDFREALKSDPYFNAVRLKFGYAITCHKSQGGEWNHVFVDFRANTMGKRSEGYFRWVYTAITRAARHLYAINAPHTRPDSGLSLSLETINLPDEPRPATTETKTTSSRQEATQTTDNTAPWDDLETLEEWSEPAANKITPQTQTQTNNAPTPVGNSLHEMIYQHINKLCIPQQITISDLQHHPYNEQYTFSQQQELATLMIYYNGKNTITKIRTAKNSPLELHIAQQLQPLVGKNATQATHSPETSTQNNTQTETAKFTEQAEFLQEYYQQLKQRLQPHGIQIESVKHHQYQEQYTFIRNKEKAVICIYYDKNQSFTRTVINERQTNSRTLLEAIDPLLKA